MAELTLPSAEEILARQQGTEYTPPPKINQSMLRARFAPEAKARELMGDAAYEQSQLAIASEANKPLAWQKVSNMMLLKVAWELDDEQVLDGYEDLKQKYAKQVFNYEGPISDGDFFGKASEHFNRNDSRAEMLSKSVPTMIEQIENGAPFVAFSRNFDATNKDALALDTVGRDATSEALRRNWDTLLQRRQELAPAIEAAASYLRDFDVTGTDMGRERADLTALSSLPLEDQQLAIAFASQRVKKQKPEQSAISKAIDEGISAFGGDLAQSAFRGFVRTQQSAAESITGTFGMEQRNENLRTLKLLTSAYYGEVDPTVDPSWSEKSWFSPKYWYASVNSAAESAFQMGLAASGVGLPMIALAGKSDMKEEMMTKYGISENDAGLAAGLMAVPYTYLDRVEQLVAFGKIGSVVPTKIAKSAMLKSASKLFNPVAMAQASRGTQLIAAGARVAAGTAIEMATETTQNLLPTVGADVISQFQADMPEVDWDKYKEVVGDSTHQVFGPALIFAMLGAGSAHLRERKIERVLLKDRMILESVGFQKQDIEQLMQAESVDEFEQMAKAYWPRVEAREAQREAMDAVNKQTQSKIEGKGLGFEMAGDNLFVATAKPAPEIVVQKHQEVFADPEVQAQVETGGVPIEIRKADGTIVPGVAKGYDEGFTEETPLHIMEWDGQKMVSTELKADEDIVTPVSGPEQWKSEPTQSVGPVIIERNESNQYVVKTTQDETVGTANTPEMAAQIVNDYASGAVKPVAVTPEQKDSQRQSITGPDGNSTPEMALNPPTTYRAHSESDSAPFDENVVGMTQADIEVMRQQEGFPKLDKESQLQHQAILEYVKGNNLQAKAKEVASDVLVTGRVINAVEHAQFLVRHAELQNTYDTLLQSAYESYSQFANAEGDAKMALVQEVREEMDRIEQADYVGGSRAGAALGIRRMRINREDYTLEKVKAKLGVAKKGALTPEEEQILSDAIKNIQLVDAKIKKLEADVERTALEAMRADAATAIKERRTARKGVDIATRAQRRQSALDSLKSLGYRLNAVSNGVGMAYEASIAIANLADTFIEEGVDKLDDLVAKMQQAVPDLSNYDIFYSVGRMATKQKKRLVTEITERKKELQKQARLLAKIDMLMNGESLPRQLALFESDTVKLLRKELLNLRKQAARTSRDQQTVENLEMRLSDLEDMISHGYRMVEKNEKEIPSENVQEIRNKYNQAKRMLRTQDAIFDLQDQIRRLERGENAAKVDVPEVENVVMREDLRKALIERQQAKRKLNNLIEERRKRSALDWGYQLFNENRALKSTADLSVFGRQGQIGALSVIRRNPVAGTKEVATAFIDSVVSFVKQDTADGMNVDLKRDPLYLDAVGDGMWFSELDAVPAEREEQFMGLFIERIPVLGSVVRGSNRFSVSYMNAIRMAMYRGYREAVPDANRSQRKLFSGWINRASGRGNLGALEGSAGALNVAFFSARFSTSRIQVMLAPLTYSKASKDYDPEIYKEVMKDWLAYVGFGFTTIGIMNLLGADIEDDPSSPDFLKGKFGDTRLEYWAGTLPPVRLTARFLKASANRAKKAANTLGADFEVSDDPARFAGAMADFVKFKMSPGVSSLILAAHGEDIMGREAGWREVAAQMFVPITFIDIYDSIEQEQGAAMTTAVGVTSALGGSAQTY